MGNRVGRYCGWKRSWIALALVCVSAALSGAPLSVVAAPAAVPALSADGVGIGFIVHLGRGDGGRTLQLRAGEGYIVQGLDTSEKNVAVARGDIAARGLYGPVTVRAFDGKSLPYIDGTVNLLVVDEPFGVTRAEMLRVLCPNGALRVRAGDSWQTETKPWPSGMDEWTHYHHDPQGTMVGKDTIVGPPRHIQWVGDPKWLRNHDFMSSLHALVSARGRIFYIIDEGLRAHVFLPAQWTLVARDGFNGAVLWKRPLKDWHPANWPLKSGPGDLPRRLVAVGDRVFVTLGLREPLSEVSAITGETIRTYEGTQSTQEVIFADGVLYLVVEPGKQPVDYRAKTSTYAEINHANTTFGWSRQSPPREIMAVGADSGRTLWKHAASVAPLSLTVGDQQVFFCDGESMVALDRGNGAPRWASEKPARLSIKPATGPAPRVVYADGVAVLCHGTQVFGFAAENGTLLWTGRNPPTGHHCPSDLFAIDGLIWAAHTGRAQEKGTHFTALDLRTGATAKDFVAPNLPGFPMHPRCYPGRATERFIMTPGIGTEFYPLSGGPVDIHNYVRGSCIYGVMPCNGLLYKPPDSCACYYMSKLEHFCALAPANPEARPARPIAEDARLIKGPAYSAASADQSADSARRAGEWPMLRHDAARSGYCPSAVPAEVAPIWQAPIGGKLTQPIIAGGKVFVVSVESQTLHALDAGDGKTVWTHTAGGRIDSPPTIAGGLVIFGAADGRVYSLRAADGALAWSYLVAPQDRQIISYQQPESLWPLNGSVLVHGDRVYALAGRSMFFDGGMRLAVLDRVTGRKLFETILDENDPETGKNLQTLIARKAMPVTNPDILSCDGRYVYMMTRKFDLDGRRVGPEPVSSTVKEAYGANNHLFCPTGFLDDAWFHRSYFVYGENAFEGWSEYSVAQRQVPCGRIMVVGESRAYAFRADNLGNTLLPTPSYRLYSADTQARDQDAAESPPPSRKDGKAARRAAKGPAKDGAIAGPFKVYWQLPDPPLLANAMALGNKSLFVAGPPDVADETKMLGFLPGADDEANRQLKTQDDAWRGKLGGLLCAYSAADGKELKRYQLESVPVWDGLSIANERLFVSLQNGKVICLGAK